VTLDLPLALHLVVLGALVVTLLQREIAGLLPSDHRPRAWRRLDAAVTPLLLVFAFLAATRLADLL